MRLFEDLNSGKYNLILIIILFMFVFHQYSCKNQEYMADLKPDLKDAISQIYLAGAEAIKNLSNVAVQLQAGGLTIPGNLKESFNIIPKGTIVAFNSETIPEGWALCNGSNGTPDLRGRFIRMHSSSLSDFNEWGGKNLDEIVVSYEPTIAGNSRDDKKSWILNHKFGDHAGTDHHTLNVNEMPSHTHNGTTVGAGGHSHTFRPNVANVGESSKNNSGQIIENWGSGQNTDGYIGGVDDHGHNFQISNTGGVQGHNNQPPYWVLSYIMKI